MTEQAADAEPTSNLRIVAVSGCQGVVVIDREPRRQRLGPDGAAALLLLVERLDLDRAQALAEIDREAPIAARQRTLPPLARRTWRKAT